MYSCSVARSCLTLVTSWTVAFQAPLFMGFSGQEYWSGLLFSPPENLPNPGIKPSSPALAGGFCTASATWEAPVICCTVIKSNPDIQKCGFFSD